MLKLRVVKEGSEIQKLDLSEIDKGSVRLGREDGCDVRLNDRAVGREHAIISMQGNVVQIQKKSKFGKLFINGTESTSASLKAGDVLGIAEFQVFVEDSGSSPVVEETPPPAEEPMANELQLDAPSESVSETAPKAEEVIEEPKPEDAPLPDLEVEKQDENLEDVPVDLASDPNELPPAEPVEEAAIEAQPIDGGEQPVNLDPPTGPEGDGGIELGEQSIDNANPEIGIDDGDDDKTSMNSMQNLEAQLIFNPGDSNFEQFKIEKSEAYIGRGTECDVILTDEKASRKHAVIRRVGAQFMLQDLQSANGTFVNGEKVQEKELVGDDVIKIGQCEFTFKAINQDYVEQEQDFMQVEAEEEAPVEEQPEMAQDPAAMGQDPNAMPAPVENVQVPAQGYNLHQENTGSINTGAIPGLGAGEQKPAKETLMEKFKRQPLPRKILIVAGVMLVLLLGIEEEDPKKKNARKPAAASKQDVQFKTLPKEKQQFVINTYQLAFDLYKNQEFEKALFEIKKVLDILPGGYKDSKDIKIYAEKAIEIKQSKAEEARRKEEQAQLRKEISVLTKKAEELVAAGKYREARDLFASVLERDPENPTVLRLTEKIEEQERAKLVERKREEEREAKRQDLLALVKKGRALLKKRKYYEVMDLMADAPALGSTDQRLLRQAKSLIKKAKYRLRTKTKPHLDAGEEALQAGNFPRARDSFYKALEVDYKNKQAKAGLAKVRKILHDRAKRIYTKAIIAEAVSDYETAKAQYRQCLDVAMKDDIYFGRCTRKLDRFSIMERNVASEDVPVGVENTDPEEPTFGGEDIGE